MKTLKIELEYVEDKEILQGDSPYYSAYNYEINCLGEGDTIVEALADFGLQINKLKKSYEESEKNDELSEGGKNVLNKIRDMKGESHGGKR